MKFSIDGEPLLAYSNEMKTTGPKENFSHGSTDGLARRRPLVLLR